MNSSRCHRRDPYTRPDFSRIALITVDVQRDTLDGQPLEVPGTSAALPRIRRVLEAFRRAGLPIVPFTGCNFPNCPRTSIYEASERDFRIVLVEDAVSGLYDRGREEMRNIGVVLMEAGRVADTVSAARGGPEAGRPVPG